MDSNTPPPLPARFTAHVGQAVVGARRWGQQWQRRGDLEGMKELLDSGTDVNYRDINGRTALHVAACKG
ncbi:hypothetical protein C3L33_08982, partial [Rhododendron williamsianum]